MKKKKLNLRDLKDTSIENKVSAQLSIKEYIPSIFSFVLLIVGIAVDYFDAFPFFNRIFPNVHRNPGGVRHWGIP